MKIKNNTLYILLYFSMLLIHFGIWQFLKTGFETTFMTPCNVGNDLVFPICMACFCAAELVAHSSPADEMWRLNVNSVSI